jgi:DNA-binding Lrp family transcriptional regulator
MKLTKLNLALMAIARHDGWTTSAALAESQNISLNAARLRLLRLAERGFLKKEKVKHYENEYGIKDLLWFYEYRLSPSGIRKVRYLERREKPMWHGMDL